MSGIDIPPHKAPPHKTCVKFQVIMYILTAKYKCLLVNAILQFMISR